MKRITILPQSLTLTIGLGLAACLPMDQSDPTGQKAPSTTATTLVFDDNGPLSVTADDTHLYWTNMRHVMRAPIAGGPAEVLAHNVGSPVGLTVDDAYVYFFVREEATPNRRALQRLFRLPKGGGTPEMVAPCDVGCYSVVVDGLNAYFADERAGNIWRAPKGGGRRVLLANSDARPRQVAVDDHHVYWINFRHPDADQGGSVERIRKDGTARQLLARFRPTPLYGGGVALDVDATHVTFWGYDRLLRVAKNGGPVHVLLENVEAQAITVTGAHIYFASGGFRRASGRLGRIHIEGGQVTWLAQQQYYPRGVTVRAGTVYWTENRYPGGTIRSIGR